MHGMQGATSLAPPPVMIVTGMGTEGASPAASGAAAAPSPACQANDER